MEKRKNNILREIAKEVGKMGKPIDLAVALDIDLIQKDYENTNKEYMGTTKMLMEWSKTVGDSWPDKLRRALKKKTVGLPAVTDKYLPEGLQCIVAEKLEKRHTGQITFYRAAVFISGEGVPFDLYVKEEHSVFGLLKNLKVNDKVSITNAQVDRSTKKINTSKPSEAGILSADTDIGYNESAFREYVNPRVVPISKVLQSKPTTRVSVKGRIQKVYDLKQERNWKKKNIILQALDDDLSIQITLWNRSALDKHGEGSEVRISACKYEDGRLSSTSSTSITEVKQPSAGKGKHQEKGGQQKEGPSSPEKRKVAADPGPSTSKKKKNVDEDQDDTVPLEMRAEIEKNEISRKRYMEALKQGKAPCKRHRLMVVGPAGVGKTSLIKRLTEQEFDSKEASTDGVEQNTVQVDSIHHWRKDNVAKKDDLAEAMANYSSEMKEDADEPMDTEPLSGTSSVDSNSTTRENDFVVENSSYSPHDKIINRIRTGNYSTTDMMYSIWDFGGQTVYYISHPLFLSWRSLYIVVFDLSLDLSDEPRRKETTDPDLTTGRRVVKTNLQLIHFWLMSIYTHAVPPNKTREELDRYHYPKILLIGTFSKNVSEEDAGKREDEVRNMIKDQPYRKQIVEKFIYFDNKECSENEINDLRTEIDTHIKEAPYVDEQYPVKWLAFGDKVDELQQEHTHQGMCCTITRKEAEEIMTELDIDSGIMDTVLNFYHDSGRLIYHQGCDLIVLDPQWLNDRVREIITVIDKDKMQRGLNREWEELCKKGLLSEKLIKQVWNGKEDYHDILNVMERCDLLCKGAKEEELQYFVPCRSQIDMTEMEKSHEVDEDFAFIIDFGDFLPVGFVHRFYVRLAGWVIGKGAPTPNFRYRRMIFSLPDVLRAVVDSNPTTGEENQIHMTLKTLRPRPLKKDADHVSRDLNQPEHKPKKIALQNDFIPWLGATLNDLQRTWARRLQDCIRIGKMCSTPDCRYLLDLEEMYKERRDIVSCEECAAPIDIKVFYRIFGASSSSVDNAISKGSPSVTTSGNNMESKSVILRNISKEIGNSDKLMDLGLALKIGRTQIHLCQSINRREHDFSGTTKLLMDWGDTVKEEVWQSVLWEALDQADFIAIAQKHLKLGN